MKRILVEVQGTWGTQIFNPPRLLVDLMSKRIQPLPLNFLNLAQSKFHDKKVLTTLVLFVIFF